MFKLGIQIYSVRDEYAQNPLSCFRQMKQCGYDGAELFGSIKTHPAEQLKAWLEEAGLEICRLSHTGCGNSRGHRRRHRVQPHSGQSVRHRARARRPDVDGRGMGRLLARAERV